MAGVRIAKDLFLWSMSVIYLFAFGSLYVQLPGLFGDNGILPARLVVKGEAHSWGDLLDEHPTLLRLTPKLGLSTQSAMDLLCLAGIVTSFMCMVFKGLRDTVSFVVLWMLYLSLYHVSRAPPIVAPHQPRLDWQLWFAALSNYQNNPWFLNLIYRLLDGQKEVLDLVAHNPFPKTPPKYMKATLYHYHFTKDQPNYDGYTSEDWWTRTKQAEYLPELMEDDETFVNYLKSAKIIQTGHAPEPATIFGSMLESIRNQIGRIEGFVFVMSLFGSGLAVQILNMILF